MIDFENNPAIGQSWEEFQAEVFTTEEIAASNLRVAIMGEIITACNEKGISQKKLEQISGVKKCVIAEIETGTASPQLDTVLKILLSLGKLLRSFHLNRTAISN